MRRRHHHRAPVARAAGARRRRALQRGRDIRAGGEHLLELALGEVLGRARDQQPDRISKQGLPPGRLGSDLGGAPQAARRGDHLVAAVHHPDARRGALQAEQDRVHLVVAPGGAGEELRALVQRGRHRARHREQGLLLLLQQEALDLVHVQDAGQRQRGEREQHERELHAQAEAQALHPCQR